MEEDGRTNRLPKGGEIWGGSRNGVKASTELSSAKQIPGPRASLGCVVIRRTWAHSEVVRGPKRTASSSLQLAEYRILGNVV
jgi:hypothetical protein